MQDRPTLQALREWLVRAAQPVRQDRLEQLDNQALQVLLDRRGLPDFPDRLVQLGLLDPPAPKALPEPPVLKALQELLAHKDPKGHKA